MRAPAAATLQINIGLTCDLACRHCHVESSPLRFESMLRRIANRLLELTSRTPAIHTVDIAGCAPELHAEFRYLVKQFTAMDKNVMDRYS